MKNVSPPDPLAVRLNEHRLEVGMSVAEWSRRSGIGDATIRHLLRGTNGASVYTLEALAGVFGLELCLRPTRPRELDYTEPAA